MRELVDLYDDRAWWLKRPDPSPLLQPLWGVPGKIETDGGDLIYLTEGFKDMVRPDQKTIRRDMLGGFLRLAAAPDEAIRDYAQRWGVLGLCKHDRPITHKLRPSSSDPELDRLDPFFKTCDVRKRRGWYRESLARWRYYSQLMSSMIALAVALRKTKPTAKRVDTVSGFGLRVLPSGIVEVSDLPGRQEDWENLFREFTGFSSGSINKVLGGRRLLSHIVNHLLDLAEIRPRLWWDEDDPAFSLYSRRGTFFLFGPLTVQLMLVVAGAPDYSTCYGCGKAIFLRKGQSVNRRSFCDTCGPKKARQEATKRYNLRKRDKLPTTSSARKRLTPKQTDQILKALRRPTPGIVKKLASKYGVTEWAIYKIGKRRTDEMKGGK